MAQSATKPKPAEDAIAVKETAKAVERQSRKVADSAHELRQSSTRIETSAEITYAAWVRTGLFALASGIGARALLTGLMPEWLIQADASLLIAFSVFCFGAAIWRHLNPGPAPPLPYVGRIPGPVLIAINGFLALVSIAALIGIWLLPAPGAAPLPLPGG